MRYSRSRRYGKIQWKNVEAVFGVELYRDDAGVICHAKDDSTFPFPFAQAIKPLIPDDPQWVGDLRINFKSSGYYDPGNTYGDPDSCWPPEGEDERLPNGAEIDGVQLDDTITEQLFDFYVDEINDVELPAYEQPEPDYDDWGDD